MNGIIESKVRDAANRATEIAKTYGSEDPAVAINHGWTKATAGQPRSFVLAVLAELRKRGFYWL